MAADQLPQDVLADVLARMPPRTLAASRAVCREWRAAADADARCRLRADLLPISLGGIFITSHEPDPPDFFARPSSTPARRAVGGRLERYVDPGQFVHDDFPDIIDCCNGLLLLEADVHRMYVVNPATKQWARLPPYPKPPALSEGNLGFGSYFSPYLVFDPTLSPHYEVVALQVPFNREGIESQGLEWPPSLYIMRVCSSRTGRWEERPFSLEEELQGGIDGVRSMWGQAAYWHGALYVHRTSDFVMRINLSNDKYRLIKLPSGFDASVDHEFYLGKSKNGIYFATITNYQYRVHIWFLDESGDKMKWVLKRSISARAVIQHFWNNPHDQTDRPWILQDGGFDQENDKEPNTAIMEKDLDWDSDDDSAINIKDCDDKLLGGSVIFGFHPYKQIVFLHYSTVLAYHFDSSKVQDLGELHLKYPGHLICKPFVYTPCWAGEMSENN
ncbi:unnamed protein product [Urochloa humidicola]